MSENEPEPDAEATEEFIDRASQTDIADRPPDPDEVEPLGETDGVYQRDADGDLRPLDWEVIEWRGQHYKVRYYPVPIGDAETFRSMGDTLEIETMCDILVEKVHTPDRTAEQWADTDPDQFNAVVMGLTRAATGEEPTNEFHEQVREELEEHQQQAAAGNEDAT